MNSFGNTALFFQFVQKFVYKIGKIKFASMA